MHECHAAGCQSRTAPEMFMCKKHWKMLPKVMRDRIWATYRPGQCEDWLISQAYSNAAQVAVQYLGSVEGKSKECIEDACRVYKMLEPGE